jgi:3-phenylpropionate/trans-cinnamate dioxygenase ferredoxin subunit
MKQYKIVSLKNLPQNTVKSFTVGNKRILISNINGKIYAADDLCTHSECSLGTDGFLDGRTIICGCHGSVFDIPSGKVKSLPATEDLNTYETSVRDGFIYVRF